MSKQIKVRSKLRPVVDEDALGMAFVLLARILVTEETEHERTGMAASAAVPGSRSHDTRPAQAPLPAAGQPKSVGQSYFEEVEAIKATGVSNADAVRVVAARYDRGEMTVRTGIHQYKKRLQAREGRS